MRLGAMSYYPQWPWLFGELNITAVKSTMSLESGIPEELGDGWWASNGLGHLAPVCDIRFHHSLYHDPDIKKLYADYCREVARRFVECKEFVLWEEPNCPVIAQGSNQVDYARLLEIGYKTVKDVRPDARVYNGGMGVHGQTWFVQELEHEGALDYTDALNLHPFIFEVETEAMRERYRKLFDELAMWDKPVIFSEWGIPSAPAPGYQPSFIIDNGVPAPTENDQAERMKWCLELFAAKGVGLCCLIPADMGNSAKVMHWSHTCGVVRQDGSLKPSYEAVKDFAGRFVD